jgi:hypothetical protein
MPSCSRRGKGNKGLKKGWNQGKAAASKSKFHDACNDDPKDDDIYSNDSLVLTQASALQSSASAQSSSLSRVSLLLAAAAMIGMIH